MAKAWKGQDWGKFIENTWTWRLSAIEPFFFVGVGLIHWHGGSAEGSAGLQYRLCEGRLRAPTRDTFAYAKRLREELFIESTEQLKLTKKNLNLGYGPADGQGMARTCRMAVLATRTPRRRLRRGYVGPRARIWNKECTPFPTFWLVAGISADIPLNTPPIQSLHWLREMPTQKNIYENPKI